MCFDILKVRCDVLQLVVGVDTITNFGPVSRWVAGFPAGQYPQFHLMVTVDCEGASGQGDEQVPLDRQLTGSRSLKVV